MQRERDPFQLPPSSPALKTLLRGPWQGSGGHSVKTLALLLGSFLEVGFSLARAAPRATASAFLSGA